MKSRFGQLKISLTGLFLFPVILVADIDYQGRVAGDEAFRRGDYSTAARFYKEFQELAQRVGDLANERAAVEHRIDALILGKFHKQAERLLQEYTQKFPGRDPIAVAIWEADIFLMQNNPEAAVKNIERILPALTPDNPRRLHGLFTLARAYELSDAFSKAADVYFSISGEEIKTFFGTKAKASKLQIRAWERGVFCLILAGNENAAQQALAKPPTPKDPSALNSIKLLTAFLKTRNSLNKEIREVWKEYDGTTHFEENDLAYTIFSLIGDAAAKAGAYDVAAEAYAAAYNSCPGKEESFETLNRLLLAAHSAGKKDQAAELALKAMNLFKGSYISVKFLKEVSDILLDAEKYEDAAKYYTILAEMQDASEKEKYHAMSCLVRISAKIKLPEKSSVLLDHYFSGMRSGERHYLFAETLLNDGKYAEASLKFRNIAEVFPQWRQKALYQEAFCQISLKKYDAALTAVNELFKGKLPSRIYTDATYLRARAYEGLGRTEAAWKEYEKYSLRPDRMETYTVESLLQGGKLAFTLKNYDKSIALFERLIKQFPKSAKSIDAANWKIYIFRLLNDDRRADLATYELAYAWPDSQETFNAMYLLAENNFSSDSYKDVMKIFDDLYRKATLAEQKSKVIIGQAALAVFHKNYTAALNYLEKLQKDDPKNKFQAKAAYLHGNIIQASGAYAEAIEYYKKALTLNPDQYLFNAAKGALGDCCFILAGKQQKPELYAEALIFYREILKTSGLDTGLQIMTLYKIGRTIEMSGKDDEAIEYYKKAVYYLTTSGTPAARLWAAKAAEAICSIAEKRPIKQHIEYAGNALNILEKHRIIPAGTAEKRTDNLRKARFRPHITK